MSIYTRENGQAINCFDLLDKFHAFMVANSTYTVNKYADVNVGNTRKGKHLAIQNGKNHFHLNSSDYMSPWDTSGTSTIEPSTVVSYNQKGWLALSMSTGFDTNENWNQQPGYFEARQINDGNNDNPFLSIVAVDQNESLFNYDFFISADENTIIISVEFTDNLFTHMVFGDFNKGNWTGDTETGQFAISTINGERTSSWGISPTTRNTSNTEGNSNSIFIEDGLITSINTNNTENGGIQAYFKKNGLNTVASYLTTNTSGSDSYVGSLYNDTNSTQVPILEFDNLMQYLTINNFNNNTTLLPIEYYCSKDNSGFCKLGQLESIYIVNMKTFTNRDILTIGSEQYLILPLHKKESPQIYTDKLSRGMGMAIRIL